MINPPKRQDDYPDREMTAVGWSPIEIEIAIRRVINANKSARIETAKMEAELAIMRAMERAKR